MKLYFISFIFFVFTFQNIANASEYLTDYNVSTGGIKIGKFSWSLTINNSEYITEIKLRSSGIFSPLYKFEGNYVSSGIINSSLSESIEGQGISPVLTQKISEIYAWTIDFFKIQKGDSYKVYYENNYVNGKYIGIGRVFASEFMHKNENFYAFYYKDKDNYGEHFDEEGKTLRKAFLKAPLNFYRISSRYSKNRKHPVTRLR